MLDFTKTMLHVAPKRRFERRLQHIIGEVEYLSIIDSSTRLELYGQENRVKRYGFDFTDSLEEAGCDATMIRPVDFLSESEMTYMEVFLSRVRLANARGANTWNDLTEGFSRQTSMNIPAVSPSVNPLECE